MKTAFKWLLAVSALLFADWIIMIVLGCFSGLCHANDKFYCSVYCYIGITLLSLSVLISGYLAYRLYNNRKSKSNLL